MLQGQHAALHEPNYVQNNYEKKQMVCESCLKMFDSGDSFRSHCCVHPEDSSVFNETMKEEGTTDIKTHNQEKPLVCGKCNVIFTKEEHLIIHKETHKGEFHFVCGECKEVFTLQVDLKEHFRTKHQHP